MLFLDHKFMNDVINNYLVFIFLYRFD